MSYEMKETVAVPTPTENSYGADALWDLAIRLIETHGAEKVSRDLIREAKPGLSASEVEFVFEIVEGEL